MCGRFVLFDEVENEEIRRIVDKINSRYIQEESAKLKMGEIFPADYVPVIITDNSNKKIITPMKWGFPSSKGSGVIINARQETLDEKPMFKNHFLHKRCLIPASGFYEWKQFENRKEKYLIRTEKPAFYMAGLYNTFTDGQNTSLTAFVIITTNASKEMSDIHHRMPVIFHKEKGKLWLDHSFKSIPELKKLLTPYPYPLILSKAT